MVAYAYAAQYPNEVEELALHEAPIPGIGAVWEQIYTKFDFQIQRRQRRPRNSEFDSRTIWPSNFSVAFRKSRFDECLLIVLEVLGERT